MSHEDICVIINKFADATELYDFYQTSELVRISVALSEQFHRYSQTSEEYEKKHIKLDINDYISKYKEILQKMGIDSNDFSW